MYVLRDISLIILLSLGFLLALAVLVVLGAVNYGLIHVRWWHTLPQYFAIAGHYLTLARQFIERACQAAVAPFFAIARAQATLAGMIRELSKDRRQGKRYRHPKE